jgi:hypothetical protein
MIKPKRTAAGHLICLSIPIGGAFGPYIVASDFWLDAAGLGVLFCFCN